MIRNLTSEFKAYLYKPRLNTIIDLNKSESDNLLRLLVVQQALRKSFILIFFKISH